MIDWIILFILFLFYLDMILSYNYLKNYRRQFPKGDWTQVEANPIIRTCIRKFGLGQGIISGGIIVFIILIFIIFNSGHHFNYFIAGVYYMMCTFHFLNFMALKRLRKLKGG